MAGTYAKLVPCNETKEKIASIVNLLNIVNPACVHDLHVTVVYSRQDVPSIAALTPKLPISANGVEFDIFKNQDNSNCLVVKLQSDSIRNLHDHCRGLGATHDYPEFHPHITLSYDYPAEKPNHTLLDYFKDLMFIDFIVEPLNSNWISK